jgi:hypothetical protein
MAQQIVGRAPNILDYFQMRALARRTPTTPERDLEGENRLKIELVKAIADLEKTKSDMKKATLTGMTDMLSKFATAQASMLSALADEAKAKAMTADAKAALIKTVTGEFERINGVIAAGQPEASFMENIASPDKGIASVQTAFTSAVSNPGSEYAPLIADLKPREGSPEVVGRGFDDLVDTLDKAFVTGPEGMVAKVNAQLRGSTPSMMAVNANGAMRQVAAGIAAALQAMPDVSDDQKNLLFNELVTRAAASVEGDAIEAAGNRDIFTEYAATQRDAIDGMNARRQEVFKKLGVQIDPAMKKLVMDNFAAITGVITANDPIAQLQVARDRLAAQGIMPPDETATEEAKQQYKERLTQEFSATVPMEGFAQRVATLPVSPEIDKQIDYLKGLLNKVGEVPQDALTVATAQLRASMGDEQFDAWRRTVRAGTDEDAAVAAARNPQMLREFRGIVQAVPTAPQAPAALRALTAGKAMDVGAQQRAAAREELRTYEAQQQATPEPKPLQQRPPPGVQPPIAPFDLPEAVLPEDAAAAATMTGAPAATPAPGVAMAPAPTRFETAAEQIVGQRALLFGGGSLMAKQARGAMGPSRTG